MNKENWRRHFWYSEEQKRARRSFLVGGRFECQCKLDDGSEHEYTEMTRQKKYTSLFDDVTYVGEGVAL